MKPLFVFLLLLSFHQTTHSQDFKFKNKILGSYKNAQPEYELNLAMPYGSHQFSQPFNYYLPLAQIIAIDIVFTDFPKGANLQALNNKRVEQLASHLPGILNGSIPITFVKQTDCKSYTEATKMFHGVVIRLKKPVLSYQKGAFYLNQFLSGKMEVNTQLVSEVLNRNTAWKNTAVVCDFTGSMSPYIADMLLWFKTNEKNKMKGVLFFNDGDRTPTREKTILKTGGFYHTTHTAYDSLVQLAFECVENGDGGDLPENDVEALLYSEKIFQDAESLILIADNGAAVRDYMFAKKVKKPVHVLICMQDEYEEIQEFYLNLAFNTGGSLHTLREDLLLGILEEGKAFTYKGRTYKLTNGKIIKL